MSAQNIPSLKSLAEAAMPMPWEKSEADVPSCDKRAFKDAITPAIYLQLLAQRDELLAALQAEQEWREREADGAIDGSWDYEVMVGDKRRTAINKVTGVAQ